MASYTPNYNLKKPEGTENYNVGDFNGNMDIIDTQVKSVSDKTSRVGASSEIVCTSISDVKSKLTTYASGLSTGESKLVTLVHTNNSEQIMLPHKRYSGYLVKNYTGAYSWLAASMDGHTINFAYTGSTWYTDTLVKAGTLRMVEVAKTITIPTANVEVLFCSFSDIDSACTYDKVMAATMGSISAAGKPSIQLTPEGIYIYNTQPVTNKSASVIVLFDVLGNCPRAYKQL